MRFVKKSQLPRLHDMQELEKAKEEFAALANNPVEQAKYLKRNASKWTALRHALWDLGGYKCWYSEAILQADQGHVEHFRPKAGIAGEDHSGYWWRAFDWTNYRLAHPTVNVRITDYLTGKLAGKGTYFPLRDGSPRATNEAEEANEIPVLLDPSVPRDCRLLCFEMSSGRPIPTYTAEQDRWLHQRAAQSIQFYHLDEGTWNVERKDLVDEIERLCDDVEAAAATLPQHQQEYEDLLDDLMEYLHHTAEFSSVALQVVRERGLLEHLTPTPERQ